MLEEKFKIFFAIVLLALQLSFILAAEKITVTRPPVPSNFNERWNNLPLKISEFDQSVAAHELICRILPAYCGFFVTFVDFTLPKNTYRIKSNRSNNQVLISASSGYTAAYAFYKYIRKVAKAQIAWEGINLNFTANHLNTAYEKNHTGASDIIYYQNVCTWSYSYPWWTWEDWEKHIDWIALHGINLVLAPFQENVWTQLYSFFGMTQEEIDAHFTGPAFLAWNRMGNLRGWAGPLPKSYVNKQVDLQKKVIERLQSLGIKVAIPAFAGHVPRAFSRIFPNVSFEQPHWVPFPANYSSSLYLDPDEPLFKNIGEQFLRKMKHVYGTDHIYFADPFNEMNPKTNDPAYLAKTSKSIFNVMKSVDKKAIWLLQGWFFYNAKSFWGSNEIEAFLTAVPKGRMIVLDLHSDVWPQYERTNSYHGHPFVFCMLHNFGGNMGMYGSAALVRNRLVQTRKNLLMTMAGVGITMEGINQNYVMYEYVLDLAWWQDLDHRKYFNRFYFKRYWPLTRSSNFSAVSSLVDTVYGYNGTGRTTGPPSYAVVRSPGTDLDLWNWYKIEDIKSAVSNLLTLTDTATGQLPELLTHDLVDFTRQFLQNLIDLEYKEIKQGYDNGQQEIVNNHSDTFLRMIQDMERILASGKNFLLGKWYSDARRFADNETEAQILFGACNQVTLWGPTGNINNYAIKQWSGIIGKYAYNRWKVFFNLMKQAMKKGEKLNDSVVLKEIFKKVEKEFCTDFTQFPDTTTGDTVEIARDILRKY